MRKLHKVIFGTVAALAAFSSTAASAQCTPDPQNPNFCLTRPSQGGAYYSQYNGYSSNNYYNGYSNSYGRPNTTGVAIIAGAAVAITLIHRLTRKRQPVAAVLNPGQTLAEVDEKGVNHAINGSPQVAQIYPGNDVAVVNSDGRVSQVRGQPLQQGQQVAYQSGGQSQCYQALSGRLMRNLPDGRGVPCS